MSHVGQLFFDQDLISQVEATAPYNTNTQDLTQNADDAIFAEEAASSDPVVEYSFLGNDVSDGVLAWIAFGIDLSNEFDVTPAANLYAEGGVANANSGAGGSGAGGPGGNFTGEATNGTFASGAAIASSTESSAVVATGDAEADTCS